MSIEEIRIEHKHERIKKNNAKRIKILQNPNMPHTGIKPTTKGEMEQLPLHPTTDGQLLGYRRPNI